ncbi:hypothetical protein AAH979_41985 [Plantactinospora sp. ZYX-F-223]
MAGVSQQMLTQILRKLERVGCSPARRPPGSRP